MIWMADFTSVVLRAIESGRAVVLATVVGPDTLPSNTLGLKMVIGEDGYADGSLGSRSLDARIAASATECLTSSADSRSVHVSLTSEESRDLSVAPGTTLTVFLDPLLPPPTLLVVGAGHIAQPLSRIGKMLDFRVVVVDDRPEFATLDRFPEADEVLCGGHDELLRRFPVAPSTHVVLVTRGHVHDEQWLQAVVGSRAAYIGMIGSRRRVAGVLGQLGESGVAPDLLDRVYTPIGLDIGAETPTEIAVSILAEVVNVRRRGRPHPSSLSAIRRGEGRSAPVEMNAGEE